MYASYAELLGAGLTDQLEAALVAEIDERLAEVRDAPMGLLMSEDDLWCLSGEQQAAGDLGLVVAGLILGCAIESTAALLLSARGVGAVGYSDRRA